MPPFNESGPNRKKADEAEMLASMELHNMDLHDQNEDASGEKTDLATGEPIDNSTETDLTDLNVIEAGNGSEDALGTLPEEDDEAAKWLREHGGDDLKRAA